MSNLPATATVQLLPQAHDNDSTLFRITLSINDTPENNGENLLSTPKTIDLPVISKVPGGSLGLRDDPSIYRLTTTYSQPTVTVSAPDGNGRSDVAITFTIDAARLGAGPFPFSVRKAHRQIEPGDLSPAESYQVLTSLVDGNFNVLLTFNMQVT